MKCLFSQCLKPLILTLLANLILVGLPSQAVQSDCWRDLSPLVSDEALDWRNSPPEAASRFAPPSPATWVLNLTTRDNPIDPNAVDKWLTQFAHHLPIREFESWDDKALAAWTAKFGLIIADNGALASSTQLPVLAENLAKVMKPGSFLVMDPIGPAGSESTRVLRLLLATQKFDVIATNALLRNGY